MEARSVVRRPGGRSARVRTAVLDATLDELVEHGYAAMTIQSIADRAGVNKTSLYRRWGSKGALLADALLASSSPPIDPPDTGDVRRDLFSLWITAPMPQQRRDLSRPIAVSRALAAASVDPAVAAAHHELWQRRLDLVRAIVDRAVQRDQLPPTADPELLMDLLFGPVITRVVTRGKAPTTGFLMQILEAALHAVGAQPG
jgi:AcrR family transcriptional regulator